MTKALAGDPKIYTVNGKPATRREYLDSVAAANLDELKTAAAEAAPAKPKPARARSRKAS